MKLKSFDKELMRRVASGQTRGNEIISQFNLDSNEFWERVGKLAKKKWIVRDSQDPNTIRLGIEGYNEFVAKQKTTNAPQENTPTKHEHRQSMTDLPKDAVELMQESARQTRKSTPASRQSIGKLPPEAHVNTQPQMKTQQPPVVVLPAASPVIPAVITPQQGAEGAPLAAPPATMEERCELCKAEFKLRAGDATRAVYGHCFCGAAYHQDCYAAVSDGDAKCIRCGRRFKKHFSREAEEAMNKMKNLFD
ncbi:MAG TPA: hypothetical protein VGQ00_04650 [Candidatus Norongarragalinales archaeon]|jgi:hypothetical protein|nr:hypothetical protein [Candidatus Norongarragalinales archaeon]